MSRTIIGAIVAIAIAALTAVTYVVVTGGLADRVRKDARAQMQPGRIPQQALNNSRLDLLNISSSVEQLAADEGVLASLKADNSRDRLRESDLAFQRFRARSAPADVLAILDATGNILVMDGVNNPVASELKTADGKIAWRALSYALDNSPAKRRNLAEIWNYPGRGLMRVGVASVVDVETVDGVPRIAGAVLIAYAQSSKLAREEGATLGGQIAFFEGDKIHATSFESAKMQGVLGPVLARHDLAKKALASDSGIEAPVEVSAGGESYYAAAVRLPRFPPDKMLPADYPKVNAGVLVLSPASRETPEHGTAGNMILILGVVALVLALGAMWLSSRRILDQVDELEVGVTEIINGNLERTFRPVGDDLDGLANGLNVMLARLLGRPEPGEEEMDEDGNPIVPGRVDFDDDAEGAAAAAPANAPELAALAHEPEPDYYKRVYTEYRDARRAVGNPDEVSFEGFIAKLRVNEGKLKAQHQCKAVRFRVVTKDNKVTLKPVPIF